MRNSAVQADADARAWSSRSKRRSLPSRAGLTAISRVTTTLLTTALLTSALVACTGGADKSTQAKKLTVTEQLAAAKVKVDTAKSMHLSLRSSGVPDSVNGAVGADGSGTHAPAFKGTLDARISGFQAKVEVVAVDRLLYVKLPFTTGFVKADPKTYNAPDPAQLFATEGGISSLLTATTNPVEGKQTRVGSDVLQTITGTLPGSSVARLFNIGDATKAFVVTYGITDPDGELRTVTMTGPFFKSATASPARSTYVLTLDKYGAPVEISKP
jgi:lipoprotein LprG